jgi:hypothetical protein
MSQDSSFNMDSIESLLENMPDQVKDILKDLGKKEETPNLHQNANPKNLEMLVKIKGIMDRVDNSRDHRMELIHAMSPFLRESRQDKASKFLKALRLTKLCREALSLINTEIRKEDT